MLVMKTIAFLNLSNPCKKERVEPTIAQWKALGYTIQVSPYLYQESTPEQRALVFNAFVQANIPFIFDVSGGDLANQTLPYLDFNAYQKSTSCFHAYSDCTCVLNVLAPLRPCVLFQIAQNTNVEAIDAYLRQEDTSLICRKGVGGNIRCFLKLAGTKYFPDVKGQDLFLESHSGNAYRIASYLAQLEQIGVFDQIASLTFGQFTELKQLHQMDVLVKKAEALSIPCFFTDEIGHSKDSKALLLEYRK